MFRFYKNPETGEHRVVAPIGKHTFIVYKWIKDGVETLKFWTGSLSATAKHWRTKRYFPNKEEAASLLYKANVLTIQMLTLCDPKYGDDGIFYPFEPAPKTSYYKAYWDYALKVVRGEIDL
jgi:hypothetical protein